MSNVLSYGGFVLNKGRIEDQVLCYVPSSDATPLGRGDPVTLVAGVLPTTNASNNFPASPVVTRAATGNVIFGVVMGTAPQYIGTGINLDITYRAASTNAWVYVRPVGNDDLWAIACDDSVATLAQTQIGLNVNFDIANCDTITGLSKAMVNSNTTPATTNTLDLQIVNYVTTPDNQQGVANQKVIVRFNNIQFANQIVAP